MWGGVETVQEGPSQNVSPGSPHESTTQVCSPPFTKQVSSGAQARTPASTSRGARVRADALPTLPATYEHPTARE